MNGKKKLLILAIAGMLMLAFYQSQKTDDMVQQLQADGFVVDQLIGQEEVVIKPLGKMLQGTPGMAGATITGDGTIALILDVPSMLKRYSG